MQSQSIRITSTSIRATKLKTSSIQQIAKNHKLQPAKIRQLTEMKIMHSDNLVSIKGIEDFFNLVSVNVSANSITSISQVSFLSKLKQLNVSSNRIKTLKGIENCSSLTKIIATHNIIENFDGFQGDLQNLQFIDLAGNKLQQYTGFKILGKLVKLQEIYFNKKNATNPMCADYKAYIVALRNSNLLSFVKKVDGKYSHEILKEISAGQQSSQTQQAPTPHTQNNHFQEESDPNAHMGYHRRSPKRQNRIQQKMSMKFHELQQVIYYKQQIITQLRSKIDALQIKNSHQYKDLIKKQTELERIYTQLNEFGRQIQSKDNKLNESHRRIQQLIRVSQSNNKNLENKSEQIERLRKQINEMRVQNAQYKALSKDYQRRMSELHSKALTNVQHTTRKNEQIKTKYENLFNQNRELHRNQDEYKNRIRQLTELLRQYEYKFQSKQNQNENKYRYEKQQLIRQWENRYMEKQKQFEFEMSRIDHDTKQKIQTIEAQYKVALEQTISKYKILKKNYDEKCRYDEDNMIHLKNSNEKIIEQENIIQELQSILIKLRQDAVQSMQEKQKLFQELNSHKNYRNNQFKLLSDTLAKTQHQKDIIEKQLMDARETIQQLNLQIQKNQKNEVDFETLQQKIENLQDQLQSRKHMLEDKNDTIENLKAQIQAIKAEQEAKNSQINSLKKKNDKNKDKLRQANEQMEKLYQEYQQLLEEKAQWEDDKNKLESQFGDVKDIIAKQQSQLDDKDRKMQQIIILMEDCKAANMNQREQILQSRRELQRVRYQYGERQKKLRKQFKDLQNSWQRQKQLYEDKLSAAKASIHQLTRVFGN